jgi:hypothetical protein
LTYRAACLETPRVSSAALAIDASSVTSSWIGFTPARSNVSRLRAAAYTVAPRSRSCSAKCLPRPRLAPVTSAVRPSISTMMPTFQRFDGPGDLSVGRGCRPMSTRATGRTSRSNCSVEEQTGCGGVREGLEGGESEQLGCPLPAPWGTPRPAMARALWDTYPSADRRFRSPIPKWPAGRTRVSFCSA